MPGAAGNQMAVLQTLEGRDCLTIDVIADRTGLTRKQISLAASGLIDRRYLERVEAGCFRLTAAGRDAWDKGEALKCGPRRPLTASCRRPRRVTERDLIWRALRIAEKPTIGDLLELAGIDPDEGYSNAQRFMLALEKAGYLHRFGKRRQGTALTSNGFLRFQLLRNSGFQTPIVKESAGVVYDPNTRDSYPMEKRP